MSYNGEAYTCCTLGGVQEYQNGRYKCDQMYWRQNWSTGQCDVPLSTFCSMGQNLFTPPCKAWITAFPKGNANIDVIITNKCSEPINVNRPECACITAVNNINKELGSQAGLRVECVSNACSNAAFRTTDQLLPCPEIIDCSINIDDAKFVVNNAKQFNQNFVQQCGSKVNNTTNTTNVSKYVEYGIIAFVLLLVIIVFIVLLIYAFK